MKKTEKTDTISQNLLVDLWQNTNIAVWLLLVVLFCGAFYALRTIMLPFVAGIVLGYLFAPLAYKLEKLKISRTMATLFVFFIVILIVTPLVVLLLGMISKELNVFVSSMPAYAASLTEKVNPLFERLQSYFPNLEVENVGKALSANMSHALQLGGKVIQSILQNSMALFNVFSLVLITPVVTFYMLRDWEVFTSEIKNLLPQKHKKGIENILKQTDAALSGFIRGQLSVCVILGTYYAIGLNIIGLKLGLLVGFVAGVISFIPYVGSITGFVLSMILAFSEFGDTAHILGVVAVFLSGQFIEGNFLTPKLVGDKVGLHPVWVMFALFAGGALMGFLGLMIAVPVAAVVGILLREGIKKYKKSGLYLS